VQKVESYVGESGKQVRTKDIDLIEIAKHDSSEHLQRFFELVVAVFMQSPHKEDYIQTIMALDERQQQALVVIVQNAISERLSDSLEGHHPNAKLLQTLAELGHENELLKEELEEANAAAQKHKREATEYRERLEELEELDERQRRQAVDSGTEQSRQEIEQLRSVNDNLRQKLLQMVREHEEELVRAREENLFLQNKMLRFKEYEEGLEQLREQLAEAQGDRERTSDHDRERRRLSRVIEEKEALIAKLREKLEDVNEKNINMQESEFSLKMDLERKEFRFRQLESEVKNRFKAESLVPSGPLLPAPTSTADAEELDYLQEEVEKLRGSCR
jgi:chromosome segregation ATPase